MHYVWIDKSGLRGKTPKRVARRIARGRKRGNAKAGTAAKRQSAWRGGSPGLAKAGTAAKTLWAWRGAAVAIGEGAAFFSQRLGQPQILRLSRKGEN